MENNKTTVETFLFKSSRATDKFDRAVKKSFRLFFSFLNNVLNNVLRRLFVGLQIFIGEASNESVQGLPRPAQVSATPRTICYLRISKCFSFPENNRLFSICGTIALTRALDTHPCLTNTGSNILLKPIYHWSCKYPEVQSSGKENR